MVYENPSHRERCPHCGNLTRRWHNLAARIRLSCEYCGFAGRVSNTPLAEPDESREPQARGQVRLGPSAGIRLSISSDTRPSVPHVDEAQETRIPRGLACHRVAMERVEDVENDLGIELLRDRDGVHEPSNVLANPGPTLTQLRNGLPRMHLRRLLVWPGVYAPLPQRIDLSALIRPDNSFGRNL